jgi:hypothetical protein
VEELLFSGIECTSVSDVRQIEIHTAKLGSSQLEVDIAIAK